MKDFFKLLRGNKANPLRWMLLSTISISITTIVSEIIKPTMIYFGIAIILLPAIFLIVEIIRNGMD